MDIEALKLIILDNLAHTDLDRTLALASDALESPAIQQLFDDHLDGALMLREQLRDPIDAPDSITILGTSYNMAFTDMAIAARFGLTPEGEPTCVITAVPDEVWSFASSFPDLDATFLPLLEFTDAALSLASHDVSDTVKQGLSFSGNLQLTERLAAIAWLLGNEESVALTGDIVLQEGLPLVTLSKRLPGLDLGFLQLPFVAFEVGTVLRELADESVEAAAQITLRSAIAFQASSGTVEIPLSTTLFLYSREAEFAANLTQALGSGLDGLSSLANGVDFSEVLPSNLSISEQVALSDLVFGVNLRDRQLQSVRITVESTQPWILVEDAISIEKLVLKLRVDDVMTLKRTSLAILGEIGLN